MLRDDVTQLAVNVQFSTIMFKKDKFEKKFTHITDVAFFSNKELGAPLIFHSGMLAGCAW